MKFLSIFIVLALASCTMTDDTESDYEEMKKNYLPSWSMDIYLSNGFRKMKREDVESYISAKKESTYFNYNFLLKYKKDNLYIFVYEKNNKRDILECSFSGDENNMLLESYTHWGRLKSPPLPSYTAKSILNTKRARP